MDRRPYRRVVRMLHLGSVRGVCSAIQTSRLWDMKSTVNVIVDVVWWCSNLGKLPIVGRVSSGMWVYTALGGRGLIHHAIIARYGHRMGGFIADVLSCTQTRLEFAPSATMAVWPLDCCSQSNCSWGTSLNTRSTSTSRLYT